MNLFTRLIGKPVAALYRHLKWLLSALSAAMSSLFVLYLEMIA